MVTVQCPSPSIANDADIAQLVDEDNGATGKRTASTRPAATSASTPATDEAGDEDKAKDAAGDEVKAKAGAGSEREPQGKYQ